MRGVCVQQAALTLVRWYFFLFFCFVPWYCIFCCFAEAIVEVATDWFTAERSVKRGKYFKNATVFRAAHFSNQVRLCRKMIAITSFTSSFRNGLFLGSTSTSRWIFGFRCVWLKHSKQKLIGIVISMNQWFSSPLSMSLQYYYRSIHYVYDVTAFSVRFITCFARERVHKHMQWSPSSSVSSWSNWWCGWHKRPIDRKISEYIRRVKPVPFVRDIIHVLNNINRYYYFPVSLT